MKFPPVYPITPVGLGPVALRSWALEILDAGAEIVQYREKNRGDGELFRNAETLVRLFEPYSARLVINDRVDIAIVAGAGGIHLGERDLPAAEVRKLAGDEMMIGVSTHTLEDATAAFGLPADYIALGPVYPTGTKADTSPVVSEETMRKVAGNSPKPVVAIGGITPERARELWRIGFASVAAIQAFAEEPGKSYRDFLKACENR